MKSLNAFTWCMYAKYEINISLISDYVYVNIFKTEPKTWSHIKLLHMNTQRSDFYILGLYSAHDTRKYIVI